jgi:kynurenine formamidase
MDDKMLIDVSLRLKDGMFFRKGSPSFSITQLKCFHEGEGQYETSMINTPSHIGTHIDIVNKNNKIELSRFIGRGVLIDISNCNLDPITLNNIHNKDLVKKDDFVFFRSCWSKNIGDEKYFDHPELSFEIIEWLSKRKVNMVGIDALGLGKGKNHGAYDKYLAGNGIYVIENLINLDSIKDEIFTVYCFPLNIENLEAIPARVVVQI